MRTVSVINQKGGVGKTTTTVNLGAAMARAGCRTCLIDLDPQAHLSLHLGIRAGEDTLTAYDLLLDPSVDAASALVQVEPNLTVLPAETDLAALESDLASQSDRHVRLRQVFEQFTDFDVIMLDCPPSLGVLTLNALAASHEVLVPLQAHFLALQGVGKLLETVGMVGRGVNPSLQVGAIALCMHESHTTLAREVVDDLRSFLENARDKDVPWSNCRLLDPPIRRNVKLAEAPSFGQSIFAYDAACNGAVDYQRLAMSVLAMWALRPAEDTTVAAESDATDVTGTDN
ncbi:MAG: ParA family protein [Phycisphaerales bacterium]|nr:ParA family protein [Phycisphaerales bacterium]